LILLFFLGCHNVKLSDGIQYDNATFLSGVKHQAVHFQQMPARRLVMVTGQGSLCHSTQSVSVRTDGTAESLKGLCLSSAPVESPIQLSNSKGDDGINE